MIKLNYFDILHLILIRCLVKSNFVLVSRWRSSHISEVLNTGYAEPAGLTDAPVRVSELSLGKKRSDSLLPSEN